MSKVDFPIPCIGIAYYVTQNESIGVADPSLSFLNRDGYGICFGQNGSFFDRSGATSANRREQQKCKSSCKEKHFGLNLHAARAFHKATLSAKIFHRSDAAGRLAEIFSAEITREFSVDTLKALW